MNYNKLTELHHMMSSNTNCHPYWSSSNCGMIREATNRSMISIYRAKLSFLVDTNDKLIIKWSCPVSLGSDPWICLTDKLRSPSHLTSSKQRDTSTYFANRKIDHWSITGDRLMKKKCQGGWNKLGDSFLCLFHACHSFSIGCSEVALHIHNHCLGTFLTAAVFLLSQCDIFLPGFSLQVWLPVGATLLSIQPQ